jgi:hypothetical protein
MCGGFVFAYGKPHRITKEEAGYYYNEHERLLVSKAVCVMCQARYLAWVGRMHIHYDVFESNVDSYD